MSSQEKAKQRIAELQLEAHPEGGYFKQVYESDITVIAKHQRKAGTHIYYLLASPDFSGWHRLKSDELWNFYEGEPLTIFILQADGNVQKKLLGPLSANAEPTIVVPANHWFAAAHVDCEGYTLVGCTVMPGFVYEDFEMAKYEELIRDYPAHIELVRKYTRL